MKLFADLTAPEPRVRRKGWSSENKPTITFRNGKWRIIKGRYVDSRRWRQAHREAYHYVVKLNGGVWDKQLYLF